MKILFLPLNVASMQPISAQALNNINGVEAKCLNNNLNKYNSGNDSVIYLPKHSFSIKSPIFSLIRYFSYRIKVKKWIRWADVLHYVWGPAFDDGSDLKYAAKLNKPIFIEWVGSDIRDPAILSGINQFYKTVLNAGYEYRDIELSKYKHDVQVLFSKAGAIPTVMPEMSLYLDKQLFPSFIPYPHRINIRDYSPEYPSATNNRPLIIHSPSVKIGKGSNVIVDVIEKLRMEYDFDFTLVHDLERTEALKLMRKADIFIDQIIVGGYGMASCEAMAFGKPVVNYIMTEVFDAGLPIDCPIVNANPDTLKDQLTKLIQDPVLRSELGKKSRLFVERYNNAETIMKDFINIYQASMRNTSHNHKIGLK